MKRVVVYGCAVWAALVAISLILLPAEGKHEALYESIKLTVLVAAVLGATIRHLSHRPAMTPVAAALVGAAWAAVCVALDLVLYLAGAFTVGLDVYFTDVASSYLVMPVITTLAMTWLEFRAAAPAAPESEPAVALEPAVVSAPAPVGGGPGPEEPNHYIPVGHC
ncbi:hypothetical protein Cs7R123_55040 [Catellatospora sp. TT07R-123]|uniref:hypothetical protein n=1 Tax=Catellatospora sp. TT07R-123 TaxID=2733863 RepID=UPI001B1681C5|nr:hypothetical protein [Catellatospora sp. TT07R-123]GHJ48162.1 hypothetical protein Cs7R123_55040 [Catellatospora sp. TT07R-123]